jgi:hypothetical protein
MSKVTDRELKVCQSINSSSSVSDTYTPANGEKIYIDRIIGNAAFSINSIVEAIWDPDGTPEIFWLTKGAADEDMISDEFTGNGTKKLAIKCTNGEAGAIKMYGKIKFKGVV